MAEIGGGGSANGHHAETLDIKDEAVSSTANSASLFTIPFLPKVGSRVSGNIFHGVCRVWGGGGGRGEGSCDRSSWNCHRMGSGGDGDDLLRRPHLRCPFQPCGHHCFCLLQEIPFKRRFCIRSWFKSSHQLLQVEPYD
ncbi:unnamed protein product [Lactuca virosa]|uniref:Uncharacterized protein n=1 Tax=Lactuca virosa TaxID=75947 RepID=A0AAU9PSN7_9ASTR|nr:unnamed protein product [Lactuca virosa]